ncbi:hypothetical protein [Elongatibacter sediminis]|uniref:Uncharacterized protein n=1 Tax=Elongatibacter sediminis TaxID=3119006 RepID=A0AAW9R5F1_9GAMM
MFKYTGILLLGTLFATSAWAQDAAEEDYEVVLPDAAQKCVLPASPDAIPPDADYDALLAAKEDVATFQAEVASYRECLQEAESAGELTPGNKQALVSSFNYTVDMEERVAARFNEAVRTYKAQQAEAEE